MEDSKGGSFSIERLCKKSMYDHAFHICKYICTQIRCKCTFIPVKRLDVNATVEMINAIKAMITKRECCIS